MSLGLQYGVTFMALDSINSTLNYKPPERNFSLHVHYCLLTSKLYLLIYISPGPKFLVKCVKSLTWFL